MVDNSSAVNAITYTEKKAQKAAEELANMGKEAATMAASVAAAGAAVLSAVGVKSVKAADDFRKSMNLLQAQTGKSKDEMAAFEESAKRLYKSGVGEDFNDIARAMSEITRTTGVSGEELENTTKNALKLRDVFEFDVNESARAANSLMKQFGISSDEAFALIAQGAQQGANKNGDLLDTLNEYSVQFKSLGFSAEQFTGALIDGAKNGAFSIDKVGDAVKEFNIRAKDGSKTSMSAFEELGMNAEEMTRTFAEGGPKAQTAFQQVAKALGGITDPVKRNAIGVKLFGTQFEDLESGAITALGNIQSKTDQTAKTIENMTGNETFGSAFKKIGRQLTTDFFIPLGEKLLPKLLEFSDWIKKNQPAIQNTLGNAVKVVGGLFTGLAKAVEFLIDAFKTLYPLIIMVTMAIAAQRIIDWIVKAYKLWTVATKGQTVAQVILNAVTKASPFGWLALIIGAVIAAVVLLIVHWDKVKKAAVVTWNAIKKAVTVAWNAIKKAFMAALKWMTSIVGDMKNRVVSIFKSMGDGMKSAWTATKNVLSTAIEAFANVVKKIFTGIKAAGGLIWDLIKSRWDNIKANVSAGVQAFSTAIKTIFTGIKSAGGLIWDSVKSAWTNVKTSVESAVNTFSTHVKNVFTGIKSAGTGIWSGIKDSVKGVFDWITEYIDKAVEGLKSVFTGFKTFIGNIFNGMVELMKVPLNLMIGILNGFINLIEGGLNLVIDAINKLPTITIPDRFGGGTLGVPDFNRFDFDGIDGLAEGGSILRGGSVMVGEEGPELLNLPRGAEVRPLDKVGEQVINININNAKILNNKDAAELADRIVSVLKLNGIRARGV